MHTAFTRCFSVSVSEHLKAKHWNQQNHQRHILQKKCLKFVVWAHRVFFNIACKVSQNEIEELLSKRKRNLIPAGNACFPFVFDLQRHLPEKWFLSPGSRVGLPPFWPRARGRRLLLQLRKADLTKKLFLFLLFLLSFIAQINLSRINLKNKFRLTRHPNFLRDPWQQRRKGEEEN